jgi:hypothetical protein
MIGAEMSAFFKVLKDSYRHHQIQKEHPWPKDY